VLLAPFGYIAVKQISLERGELREYKKMMEGMDEKHEEGAISISSGIILAKEKFEK